VRVICGLINQAGIPIENIKGSNTSVHVGSFTDDYKMGSWRDAQQIPKYSILGVAAAVLSGRISCFFDLRGPSVTINTACSSSLVALAMSCNSLWAGESDIVIAFKLQKPSKTY
jgi:acyl transferase domain-containing protein